MKANGIGAAELVPWRISGEKNGRVVSIEVMAKDKDHAMTLAHEKDVRVDMCARVVRRK